METDILYKWKNFEDMIIVYIVFPYNKDNQNPEEPTEYENLQDALNAYNEITYAPNEGYTHKCLAIEVWVPVSGDEETGFDRELFTSFIGLDEPIPPYNNHRAKTLLLATRDLLNKQKESFYTLDMLSETVTYDGTECDGSCLIEDIENYLDIEEP